MLLVATVLGFCILLLCGSTALFLTALVTGHWQERGAAGFKVLSSGLYYICTDQSPNACFFFGANCKFDSGIVGLFGQYGLQSLESAECDNIRMVRGLLIAATVATTIALCALIVFSLYKPQTPYVRYSVVFFCLCGAALGIASMAMYVSKVKGEGYDFGYSIACQIAGWTGVLITGVVYVVATFGPGSLTQPLPDIQVVIQQQQQLAIQRSGQNTPRPQGHMTPRVMEGVSQMTPRLGIPGQVPGQMSPRPQQQQQGQAGAMTPRPQVQPSVAATSKVQINSSMQMAALPLPQVPVASQPAPSLPPINPVQQTPVAAAPTIVASPAQANSAPDAVDQSLVGIGAVYAAITPATPPEPSAAASPPLIPRLSLTAVLAAEVDASQSNAGEALPPLPEPPVAAAVSE